MKYTINNIPEFFKFKCNNIEYYATHLHSQNKNENKVYIGWFNNEAEGSSTYYYIHHVVELLNAGSWEILK